MYAQANKVYDGDAALDLSGLLDPRTKEFQAAVRFTPATLAHYRTAGKWIPAKHLLEAASIIAHEIAKGDARIIFEMPPRHGKSELASIHTPVWFLDRWPHLNVILTTYAADLSTGFGRRVRDTFIDDAGRFLKTTVRDDVQRTDVWQTVDGGGMMSVGIGGPITGRGANLLIVDDYVKNFEEAMSAVTNEATWNWFRSTAYTRVEPGGSVIVLATRWPSPDGDLIGKILAAEPGKWIVIRFPANAEEDDSLGRKPGEALWPERGFTEARLAGIRSLLGDWLYSAMYQQAPKPQGDFVSDPEQLRIVDSIPNPLDLRWVRSWDLAATDKKTRKKGDWSVGSLMGTQGRLGNPFHTTYVADMVREQWSPAAVETGIRKVAIQDGAAVQIIIEQEPGAAGKSYAHHLATNILAGFKVEIVPSSVNKTVRHQPYLAAVNHGRISAMRAAWNDVHKGEIKHGVSGKNDDTLDSTSLGYNHLFQTDLLKATWGRTDQVNKMDPTQIGRPKSATLVTGCTFGR